MKTHIDHLAEWVPDIIRKNIADIGAGKGKILIDIAKKGGTAVGLEISEAYIREANQRAAEAGVVIKLLKGRAEEMPFKDAEFDFVNMTEVIEHVQDPKKVLKEVRRILIRGGLVYMSAPNRYGFKDPHFHLYFVNWLPRSFAQFFISFFGSHKNYEEQDAGFQSLTEMHYYTYAGITKLCRESELSPFDIREEKLQRKFGSGIVFRLFRFIYHIARTLYFDSFHLRLER